MDLETKEDESSKEEIVEGKFEEMSHSSNQDPLENNENENENEPLKISIRKILQVNKRLGQLVVCLALSNGNILIANINLTNKLLLNVTSVNHKFNHLVSGKSSIFFNVKDEIKQKNFNKTFFDFHLHDFIKAILEYDFTNEGIEKRVLKRNNPIIGFEMSSDEKHLFIFENKNILKFSIYKNLSYQIYSGHKSKIKNFKFDFTKRYIYRFYFLHL